VATGGIFPPAEGSTVGIEKMLDLVTGPALAGQSRQGK